MKPSTVRAKRSLATRQAAGGRVVRVILSPEAARALDSLAKVYGSMTAAVEAALEITAGWKPKEGGHG